MFTVAKSTNNTCMILNDNSIQKIKKKIKHSNTKIIIVSFIDINFITKSIKYVI